MDVDIHVRAGICGRVAHSRHLCVQGRATIAYLVLAANLVFYVTGLGVGLVNGTDASQVSTVASSP